MHMYRYHQNAELLRSALNCVEEIGTRNYKVPMITRSVSRSADGTVNITLNNLSTEQAQELAIRFRSVNCTVTEAKVVSGEKLQSMNTFEEPEQVVEADFSAFATENGGLRVTLPAHSVVLLRFSTSEK